MSNNPGKEILNLIIEENAASAQEFIKQQLTERLSSMLDAKFEEYASTIFEGKKHKKKNKKTDEPRWQDSDGDGKWYEPGDDVKKSVNEEKYCEDGECEDEEGGEMEDEETEDEKSYGKKEKKAPKHKGGKKKKKKDEEDEEEEDWWS